MKETEIVKTGEGRLVLRESARARERRAARDRLQAANAGQVRESAALADLRAVVADLLEWVQGGGEVTE